jgi:hypothetical protein
VYIASPDPFCSNSFVYPIGVPRCFCPSLNLHSNEPNVGKTAESPRQSFVLKISITRTMAFRLAAGTRPIAGTSGCAFVIAMARVFLCTIRVRLNTVFCNTFVANRNVRLSGLAGDPQHVHQFVHHVVSPPFKGFLSMTVSDHKLPSITFCLSQCNYNNILRNFRQ